MYNSTYVVDLGRVPELPPSQPPLGNQNINNININKTQQPQKKQIAAQLKELPTLGKLRLKPKPRAPEQLPELDSITRGENALAAALANPGVSPKDLMSALLTARPVKSREATRMKIRLVSAEMARQMLARTLMQVWAPSTLGDRQALWARYLNYCKDHRFTIGDVTAAMFVEATRTSVQSQHQYAKTLGTMFKKMGIPDGILRLQMAGLRGKGALVPSHQAPPMAREHMLQFSAALKAEGLHADSTAVLQCWKSASRWDDMVKSSSDAILLSTPWEIITDAGRNTKSTRTRPFRASQFCVITGDLTEEIHHSLPKGASRPLTTLSTADINIKLARQFPNEGYTAHSFKHGAVSRAIQKAVEFKLDAIAISILAKHKTTQDLTDQTIGYAQDKAGAIASARLLGTAQITAHL